MLDFLSKTIIVTGHYGSGKTNLSMNLAVELSRQGRKIALVDLDIVNPYFRSADFKTLSEENGIRLLASPYANSNVELPTLNYGLTPQLNQEETVILDVGGDDTGAIALGQYAPQISQIPYTMLYVVNKFRSLTQQPHEAADLMEDIETASRLTVTHIVNNSNMSYATTPQDILDSIPWAQEVARLTGKEFAFTSAKRDVVDQISDPTGIYPADIYVKTVWQ